MVLSCYLLCYDETGIPINHPQAPLLHQPRVLLIEDIIIVRAGLRSPPHRIPISQTVAGTVIVQDIIHSGAGADSNAPQPGVAPHGLHHRSGSGIRWPFAIDPNVELD